MMDSNKKVKTLLPSGSLMFTNWQEIHYGSKHSDKAGGFHLELEKNWFEKYDISPMDLEGSLHLENPLVKGLMNKVYLETKINDNHSQASIEFLILDIFNKMKNSQLQRFQKQYFCLKLNHKYEIKLFFSTYCLFNNIMQEL